MSGQGPRNGVVERLERSDIGRRVALRREELGLSREQVAARAGAAPGYIEYVEERSSVPDMGALLRLAGALETSVSQLLGGNAELPPGVGRPALHPKLVELDQRECRARLSDHGVGRVALSTGEGPAILPVNYSVADGAVIFRTAPGSLLSGIAGSEVAFETDRIDEALSRGWSVLVVGRAERVTEPEEISWLSRHTRTEPWAGGNRTVWLRIVPGRTTGREIRSD